MASVTYGKCNLWQKYYVKCNNGKNIMANETELFFFILVYSTKYGLCTVPSMVSVQYQVWSLYSTKYGLCCTVPSMVYFAVQYQVWSMVIGH